ncbi:hypothetical protein SNEBB_002412 [Seison nebaliae]|nr:hypothetical protein SNEBB_002412 [Seison nebaliae]
MREDKLYFYKAIYRTKEVASSFLETNKKKIMVSTIFLLLSIKLIFILPINGIEYYVDILPGECALSGRRNDFELDISDSNTNTNLVVYLNNKILYEFRKKVFRTFTTVEFWNIDTIRFSLKSYQNNPINTCIISSISILRPDTDRNWSFVCDKQKLNSDEPIACKGQTTRHGNYTTTTEKTYDVIHEKLERLPLNETDEFEVYQKIHDIIELTDRTMIVLKRLLVLSNDLRFTYHQVKKFKSEGIPLANLRGRRFEKIL